MDFEDFSFSSDSTFDLPYRDLHALLHPPPLPPDTLSLLPTVFDDSDNQTANSTFPTHNTIDNDLTYHSATDLTNYIIYNKVLQFEFEDGVELPSRDIPLLYYTGCSDSTVSTVKTSDLVDTVNFPVPTTYHQRETFYDKQLQSPTFFTTYRTTDLQGHYHPKVTFHPVRPNYRFSTYRYFTTGHLRNTLKHRTETTRGKDLVKTYFDYKYRTVYRPYRLQFTETYKPYAITDRVSQAYQKRLIEYQRAKLLAIATNQVPKYVPKHQYLEGWNCYTVENASKSLLVNQKIGRICFGDTTVYYSSYTDKHSTVCPKYNTTICRRQSRHFVYPTYRNNYPTNSTNTGYHIVNYLPFDPYSPEPRTYGPITTFLSRTVCAYHPARVIPEPTITHLYLYDPLVQHLRKISPKPTILFVPLHPLSVYTDYPELNNYCRKIGTTRIGNYTLDTSPWIQHSPSTYTQEDKQNIRTWIYQQLLNHWSSE